MNNKVLYIDLYHPVFLDDLITTTDVLHLHSMDICTDVAIDKIVEKIHFLIFERYGDGLYIQAEEYETICYLNVFVMFGEDISSIVNYINSINNPEKLYLKDKASQSASSSNRNTFVSIDFFSDQQEIDEVKLYLDALGLENELYLTERKAFQRGAGDYHENIILSLITGSAQAIGNRLTNYLIDKCEHYQSPRISTINTDKIITYLSEQTGINKQDLHINRLNNISENEIEVIIINRYKTFTAQFNRKTNTINYEEKSKTQTMI